MRAVTVLVFAVLAAGTFFAGAIVPAHSQAPGNLMWPTSDDQGLLSDLLGVGFKLPELDLMTIKPEAWPLQECAAANFKQQPTLTWDAAGLTDEADHDLLIQKVSPIFILCAAQDKPWAESCREHYQPNICAMLTVYLVSVQNHCVRSYGRACTAKDTLKALQNAGNPPPAPPQPAPNESSTNSETVAQTIRAHCLSEWSDDFQMRAYCEKQQREAVRVLAIGKPADVSQEEFVRVQRWCASEWPDDFQMRAYCEKQQYEGIRELRTPLKRVPFNRTSIHAVHTFVENIQADLSRVWECRVKSLPRHHLPLAIAKQPIPPVDPDLDFGCDDTASSFKGGKPTANIMSH